MECRCISYEGEMRDFNWLERLLQAEERTRYRLAFWAFAEISAMQILSSTVNSYWVGGASRSDRLEAIAAISL